MNTWDFSPTSNYYQPVMVGANEYGQALPEAPEPLSLAETSSKLQKLTVITFLGFGVIGLTLAASGFATWKNFR